MARVIHLPPAPSTPAAGVFAPEHAAEIVRWVQFLTPHGAVAEYYHTLCTERPRRGAIVHVFPAGRPQDTLAILRTWGDVRAFLLSPEARP